MSEDFPITIFHNPDCGTSRNALAMIRAAGYEPLVVEYLKLGWDRQLLESLLADIPATPRDLLREKGTRAAELGLLDPSASDETIIKAMLDHPILVNRPIVASKLGVKLCRPSELVLSLLEIQSDSFTQEDSDIVQTNADQTPLGHLG